MSLLSLSMTAATFLFFQHNEYTTYDERLRTRTFGINDPLMLYTIPCTLLYVGVNAPRIWANAMVIAISPILAIVTLAPDFILNVLISHKFALHLRKNNKFPDGIVTAIINFVCPCGPVKSIGLINFLSSMLIAVKVCLLYPIIMYYDKWTVQYDNDPDHIRCWRCIDYNFLNDTYCNNTITEHTVQDLKEIISENIYGTPNMSEKIPRICGTVSSWISYPKYEEPNSLLFKIILPMTLFMLLAISVPFGFMISHLMRRSKVELYLVRVNKKIEYCKNELLACWNYVRCKEQPVTIQRDRRSMIPAADDTSRSDEKDKFLSIIMTSPRPSFDEERPRSSAIFGTDIFIAQQQRRIEAQARYQFRNVLLTFLLSIRTMFEMDYGSKRNENCKYCRTNYHRQTLIILVTLAKMTYTDR